MPHPSSRDVANQVASANIIEGTRDAVELPQGKQAVGLRTGTNRFHRGRLVGVQALDDFRADTALGAAGEEVFDGAVLAVTCDKATHNFPQKAGPRGVEQVQRRAGKAGRNSQIVLHLQVVAVGRRLGRAVGREQVDVLRELVLQVGEGWLHRIAEVRDRLLDDLDIRGQHRIRAVERERQVLKRALGLRLDHHGAGQHRTVDHLATQAIAGLNVVEDAVPEAAHRVVGPVGADAVGEQNVGLFRGTEHARLAEHEALRAFLAADEVRDRAVEFADPEVQNFNGGVLDSGVEVVVFEFPLGGLPVRESRAAGAARGAGVLGDDTLHFRDIPTNFGGNFFIADEAVELVQQVLPTGTGNLDTLLGGDGLPWDQEVAETADAELPAVRRIEVSD